MRSRVLRSVLPAAAGYLFIFSTLAFLLFQGFLLLDPDTLAQWLLMGIPAGISTTAALKVIFSALWEELVEAARSELVVKVKDRHWLPDSGRDVLRLWFRYERSGAAAQEVFRTLLDDALADRTGVDPVKLLDSAQALTLEVSR